MQIIEDIPTLQEQDSAVAMFTAMMEAGYDVRSMSRVIKHLGSLLVLYAEDQDRALKEGAKAVEQLQRGN